MTEDAYNAALKSGSITVESETPESEETSTAPSQSVSIAQFIPLLMQLQSVQQCVATAPTNIPQTFQDQIQFVFDGTNYYLYLYFNNQWNVFAVSGGGGSGVDSILAGTGITISPSGGTGNVTINASGIETITAGTGTVGSLPACPENRSRRLVRDDCSLCRLKPRNLQRVPRSDCARRWALGRCSLAVAPDAERASRSCEGRRRGWCRGRCSSGTPDRVDIAPICLRGYNYQIGNLKSP
jgi:hypothetical protein